MQQLELPFDDKPIGFLGEINMPFDMEQIEYTNAPLGESTADLLALRERLTLDMENAITSGDTTKMLRLDQQIKSLEPRLFAAKVDNLKKSLELSAERKAEINTELAALRSEKKRLNEKLARAIVLTEKRGERVVRADFALSLVEQELESVRVSMRESRERLEQIKQNKLGELKRYETEFRTNF
jgi:chromosome segregation ATPase